MNREITEASKKNSGTENFRRKPLIFEIMREDILTRNLIGRLTFKTFAKLNVNLEVKMILTVLGERNVME